MPFTCECHDKPDPATKRKIPHWFALSEDRPLAFFAGIWTSGTGMRGTKANPVEGDHTLFGFLTTDANAVVKPVHKAMPVILTTAEQMELWMSAPADEALSLQRPAPDETLRIVARGEKKDGGETSVVCS